MIEGMPASSSMAELTGPRSQPGAISVRKRAMPKLIGTAKMRAMIAVVTVPITGTRAPNWLLLGSQASLVRKPQPKVAKASRPSQSVDSAAPSSVTRTSRAQALSSQPNRRSLRVSVALRVASSARSSLGMALLAVACMMGSVPRGLCKLWVAAPCGTATPLDDTLGRQYVRRPVEIGSVLELGSPVGLDLLDQRVRQGHVVERRRLL